MKNPGTRPAPDTLRFERTFDAPVERVWAYIVEDEKRGEWFAPGPLEQRVGGRLRLTFDHDNLSANGAPYPEKYLGSKGFVAEGEVKELDPPHMIAFTWGGEDVTRFELSPTAQGGTRLVLIHSRLSEDIKGTAAGWHSHLAVLEKRLAGASLEDFWAVHLEAEKGYAALFG